MLSDQPRPVTPDLILGAIFLVLALVFPVLFHLVHLGSTFLPMFFPIAMAGLLVRPGVAVTVGFVVPILSGALTGMPPFYPPIAPQMAVEGAVLGGSIALLRRYRGFGVLGSLVGGLLAQRLVLVALVFLVAPLFHLPPGIYTSAKILSGIPGLILQLVGIPPLIKTLEPRIRQMWEVM